MRRDQLEHAIRTACQIIDQPEVSVVGSQAILGSFRESELPDEATMSVEVDILPSRGITPRQLGWPTSSKVSRGSFHRSRNCTATALMVCRPGDVDVA